MYKKEISAKKEVAHLAGMESLVRKYEPKIGWGISRDVARIFALTWKVDNFTTEMYQFIESKDSPILYQKEALDAIENLKIFLENLSQSNIYLNNKALTKHMKKHDIDNISDWIAGFIDNPDFGKDYFPLNGFSAKARRALRNVFSLSN